MLVAARFRELPRTLRNRRRRTHAAASPRRHEAGLDREAASDPAGFAGLERQQQTARLEVRRPDRVDEHESRRDGPAGIDAKQVLRWNGIGAPFDESESAQTQARAAPREGRKGARRA